MTTHERALYQTIDQLGNDINAMGTKAVVIAAFNRWHPYLLSELIGHLLIVANSKAHDGRVAWVHNLLMKADMTSDWGVENDFKQVQRSMEYVAQMETEPDEEP